MRLVRTRAEVREAVAAARAQLSPRAGEALRIAFVPTMGYLHEGHLALVDRARAAADFVVLSIFVNPLQFGAGEDLDRYPRDVERDAALAAVRGVDLLFLPEPAEIYPRGEPAVQVVPLRMADRLCGAQRPGHFQGVLTVVAKLFQIVQPDLAIFGQKDLQQATLIRRMVEDLDMPVEIELAPIVRESDGLALSSRNVYLSPGERTSALSLHRGLTAALAAFRAGRQEGEALRAEVRQALADSGVAAEYIELVDAATLEPLELAVPGAALAVAARVGRTRLIDNVILR
jgi:pantoate--beta-alanine ligase